MATAKKINLGQTVTYISSKGYEKLALVTATPETVQAGHDLPELAEGFLHLFVISPNGTTYPRLSVPSQEIAQANVIENDGDETEAPRGVWKLS